MANEICRCDAPSSDGHRPPRATVISLPPELLIMIFEHIHAPLVEMRESIRHPYACARNVEDINELITRDKAFPYPCVDVCRYWAAVILGVPRFWTNAIVFIGPLESVHGKCLGGAETIFGASRTLPFDVTIRSTRIDRKINPVVPRSVKQHNLEREQADIVNVLGLLAPHLHRCRSLSIYTLLVGAMPLVYRHLDGPAPLLKMLTLRTDDVFDRYKSGFGLMTKLSSNFSPVASTFAPPLEQLVLDGISFNEVHRHHRRICETYGANLVSLALVNYSRDFCGDDDRQPLCAAAMAHALVPMGNLEMLKLSHMYFDDDVGERDPVELDIGALILEGMDKASLIRLFAGVSFPHLEDLWIKGCWFENEDDVVILPVEVTLLTLESVADVDLAFALYNWQMEALRVCTSSAFDDTVLDMLGAPYPPGVAEADITQTTEFGCDMLRTLLIMMGEDFLSR